MKKHRNFSQKIWTFPGRQWVVSSKKVLQEGNSAVGWVIWGNGLHLPSSHSKRGPRTRSISIVWELVRDAES